MSLNYIKTTNVKQIQFCIIIKEWVQSLCTCYKRINTTCLIQSLVYNLIEGGWSSLNLDQILTNDIFAWIICVFGSHFRALACLIVGFMPLFLLLCLVSLILRVFINFDFVSQVCGCNNDLRACGSKNITQEA